MESGFLTTYPEIALDGLVLEEDLPIKRTLLLESQYQFWKHAGNQA